MPLSPLVLQPLIEQCQAAGLPMEQTLNFVGGSYVPLEWALDFHRLARECDKPDGPTEIGVGGSRGPGKSHALFAQVTIDDCMRHPGLQVLYLRKVGVEAKEQFRLFANKILANKVPHAYRESAGVVQFPNGSRVRVGNFKDERDIDKYLGMQYHIIVVEEATTLSKTKYQALRDSNRSSDGFRPRIYNSTNPGGIGHQFYKNEFIIPARNLDFSSPTRFVAATVDDNPLINKEYITNLEKNIGWRLRAYRYGDWDIAAGQYFSNFRYDVHVIDEVNFPVTWQWWGGYDHGFVHPAVFHLACQDNEGNTYIADEVVCRRAPVERIAHDIALCLERNGVGRAVPVRESPYKKVGSTRLRTIAAGSDIFARRANDGGKSIAEYFRTLGLTMKSANMDRLNGAAEVLKKLGEVDGERETIAPTLFIAKRCTRLIETIPAMVHDPDRPEDVLKVDADDDGEGGDDSYDAVRYTCMERVRLRNLAPQRLRFSAPALTDGDELPHPYRD